MYALQPLYNYMKMKIIEYSISDVLIIVHRVLYSLHKKGDYRVLYF